MRNKLKKWWVQSFPSYRVWAPRASKWAVLGDQKFNFLQKGPNLQGRLKLTWRYLAKNKHPRIFYDDLYTSKLVVKLQRLNFIVLHHLHRWPLFLTHFHSKTWIHNHRNPGNYWHYTETINLFQHFYTNFNLKICN